MRVCTLTLCLCLIMLSSQASSHNNLETKIGHLVNYQNKKHSILKQKINYPTAVVSYWKKDYFNDHLSRRPIRYDVEKLTMELTISLAELENGNFSTDSIQMTKKALNLIGEIETQNWLGLSNNYQYRYPKARLIIIYATPKLVPTHERNEKNQLTCKLSYDVTVEIFLPPDTP